MAVYNETGLDNVKNILELAIQVGAGIGDSFLLGYLILLSTFVIFLIVSFKYDIKQVLIVDGFVCTVMAILLNASGLLPAGVIIVPATLMMFTLIFYYLTG